MLKKKKNKKKKKKNYDFANIWNTQPLYKMTLRKTLAKSFTIVNLNLRICFCDFISFNTCFWSFNTVTGQINVV